MAAIASQRDYTRACGIVADIRVRDLRSDAIQVDLEHADGHVFVLQLPYAIKRRSNAIKYGQIRALPGQNRIWT